MTRLLHPMPEAAEVLGVSRSTVYELVKNGDLNVVKIGRRSFITQDELERFVQSLVDEQVRS